VLLARLVSPAEGYQIMRRDEDDRDLPKCLFCSEPNEGQRYTFWGGSHLDTTRKRAFLSSTTVVTSRYQDMKKVGVFACRQCAKGIVFRASLLTIVVFALCAVGCVVVGVTSLSGSPLIGWLFLGLGGLFGVVSLANLAMSLFPNLDSWTSDAIILKKAKPFLIRKRKGDSFFTEREYEVMFTQKPKERAETADEILEAAGLGKDEVRPRVRAGSDEVSELTRCPSCSKATPATKRKCKHCGAVLP
jgi:hypothetical protein